MAMIHERTENDPVRPCYERSGEFTRFPMHSGRVVWTRYKSWVAGGRWQVAGGRWQVAGGRWQVAGCRWFDNSVVAVGGGLRFLW